MFFDKIKKNFYFRYTRLPEFKKGDKVDYEKYWESKGFRLNKYLKEREKIILDYIPSGARVIDIGCGNSLLPVRLKEKKCSIEAADVSKKILSGYEKFGIRTKFIDLLKVKDFFTAEKYDCIILSEVLEHVPNPEQVIAHLRQFSKRIIMTVPNSAFYRYRLHLFFRGRFFTQWVYHPSEHLRFWSHIDFIDWLGAQGLILEESISSNGLSLGKFLDLKNIWKNLFGHQIIYICGTN